MKARKPKYTLLDADQINADHPDTFWVPNKQQREALKPGDIVKCIFDNKKDSPERMWVLVQEAMQDGAYRGELNNHPAFVQAKAGDTVIFSAKHVIQIYDRPKAS